MSIYFSAATVGFYNDDVNAQIPPDAVEVTPEAYAALLAAQASGSRIQADANGSPIAIAPAPLTFADEQALLCARIDATADAAYIAIGGPSPGRMAEYQQAETDASAFKAAGYSGVVPSTIDCWAQAKGWTAQQAADDILATAAAWRGALQSIRSARLLGKASVNATSTLQDAQAAADAAIANVQSAAAGA